MVGKPPAKLIKKFQPTSSLYNLRFCAVFVGHKKVNLFALNYFKSYVLHLGTCCDIPLHMTIKKLEDMNQAIVLPPNVLNTLRALPYDERLSVASALAGELILGTDTPQDLSPQESMIYSILRFYVRQASERYSRM